jgi:hypothetical protein
VAALVVGAGLVLLMPPASETCGVVEAFRAPFFPQHPCTCTLGRGQPKSETGGWFGRDADDDSNDDRHHHSIIHLTSFFDPRGENGSSLFHFQFDAWMAVVSGCHSLRAPPR